VVSLTHTGSRQTAAGGSLKPSRLKRERQAATGDRELRASVFIGTSLDGFIARTTGELDFLPPGGGAPPAYAEFIATVDALVIGRNTFETVLTFDAWPYHGKPVFVLSTRPLAAAPPGAGVERMTETSHAIVVQLLSLAGE